MLPVLDRDEYVVLAGDVLKIVRTVIGLVPVDVVDLASVRAFAQEDLRNKLVGVRGP